MTNTSVYLLLPLCKTRSDQCVFLSLLSSQNFKRFQAPMSSQCFASAKDFVESSSLPYVELGYAQLTQLLEQHRTMKQKFSLIEPILRAQQTRTADSFHGQSMDSLMKKAIKYKQLKEENKKLKKLLQSQFDNSEKVREETQRTMKVLREEFNALVREMNPVKAKDKSHTSVNQYDHNERQIRDNEPNRSCNKQMGTVLRNARQ